MRRPPNAENRLREIVYTIQQLVDGRNNAAGTVTLAVGDTLEVTAGGDDLCTAAGDVLVIGGSPTLISGTTINENAVFLPFPQTESAATEFGAGTMYAVVNKGVVAIYHGSSSTITDRTFGYCILGG